MRLSSPVEKSVCDVDDLDAAADVVDRAVARLGLAVLNRLGKAGLERRHVLLEADRVDVRHVVGDDFQPLGLGGGAFGRDVHSVRHGRRAVRRCAPLRRPPLKQRACRTRASSGKPRRKSLRRPTKYRCGAFFAAATLARLLAAESRRSMPIGWRLAAIPARSAACHQPYPRSRRSRSVRPT